ncbi:MAG TPA: hypothetical protein VF276_11945 [Chloroflexia bacterium]
MTMKVNELVSYVFSGSTYSFAGPFTRWLEASPPFRAFVEVHRDKIRKKVRNIRDDDTQRDVVAELAVARWLAGERRFAVAYEVYIAGKQRGPDFSVTFRTRIPFNVEVTRLRPGGTGSAGEDTAPRTKIANTICAKLAQFPSSVINVLVLVTDGAAYGADDLAGAPGVLAERALRKDDAFFQRRGLLGTRNFHHHYQRLSAILLRRLTETGALEPVALWANPQARHPLPADLATILRQ